MAYVLIINAFLCNMKHFKIGGAFAKFEDIFKFVSVNSGLNVSVYDGVNMCKWNGGRINRDILAQPHQIDFYKRKNIPIFLTFSNPVINLDDVVGNELLDQFYFGDNGIILVNDDLREHLRAYYPNYRLIYSITGTGGLNVPMTDADVEFYQDLEFKYDLIVPRMEHVFDERFELLDQSMYEVMVNDTCLYGCPHYRDHFEAIAEYNTQGLHIGCDGAVKTEECWVREFDPSKVSEHECMDLSIDAVSRLYDRGVSHFKISGREMNSPEFVSALQSIMGYTYET